MARGSHWIEDIKYSEDYLICICGWKGSAFNDVEYKQHRKDAPPFNDMGLAPEPSVFIKRKKVTI